MYGAGLPAETSACGALGSGSVSARSIAALVAGSSAEPELDPAMKPADPLPAAADPLPAAADPLPLPASADPLPAAADPDPDPVAAAGTSSPQPLLAGCFGFGTSGAGGD